MPQHKYKLLLIVMLLLNTAHATIRTLNNNTPSPGQYTSWAAVQAASTAGDTIYVSGNNLVSYGYATVTVNNLRIIGTGYNPSGQNNNVSFFNAITVQVPATFIDGIKATNITYDYQLSAGTLFLNRCLVNDIDVENTNYTPALKLNKNVIDGTLHIKFPLGSTTYLYAEMFNNVFNGHIIFDNNGFSGSNISNNVFKQKNSFYLIEGAFDFSDFRSNIMVNYGAFSITSNTSSCFGNCIYAPGHPSFTSLPNDAGFTVVGNPQFVNICTPCAFPYGGDYHLQPTSPCIGTGFAGNDMGVYGGVQGPNYNQRGEAPIPHIKQFTISAISGNYGTAFTANVVSWIKYNYINNPTITRGEYFWNTDPGVDNGYAFTVSSPSDSVTFSTTIQTTGAGLFNNSLYIRTCDNAGRWSLAEVNSYYINPAISAAEYFYDTDPGINNGTSLGSFTAGDSININKTISTSGVSSGYHTFYVRTKEASGVLSLSEGRVLYIQPKITVCEYFWDTDPGIDNATKTSVFTATDSLNFNPVITTTGLKKGYHTLYVRTKDTDGKWSLSEGRVIYITSQITVCEYFWDTDPGIDNATKTSTFLATDSLNFNPVITTNGLSKGYHTLYTRTKDSDGIWSLAEPRTIYVETQITAAEYFWNTDPGQGSGTSLGSVTASDSVNLNSNISVAALRDGYHTLYTRTKDLHGNWSLTEGRNIYIKPQIQWGEAFWDTDPGFFNGFPLITGLPTDSFSGTFTYSTTNMTRGLHFLYYRFQTTKNIWGLTEAAHIYVYKPLVAAEYYFDNDPGQGNGTALAVTSGTSINYTGNITLPILSAGLHKLFIRTMDSDGIWSLPEPTNFSVEPFVATTIVAGEFFVDADPGVGNGTTFSVGTPAASITASANITLPSMALGTHKIFIRTKDNRGIWSLQEGKTFIAANIATQIVAAEYYFDNDPGFGSGTALPVTPSATVNVSTGVTVPALSAGLHKLYLRSKGNNGIWSLPEIRTIYIKATQANATQVTAAEFFVDTDPGVGNATAIPIATPAATVNQCTNITLPSFAVGSHKLFIRTKDDNNVWSLQEPRTFTGIASGSISISPAGPVTICQGQSVTLTSTTTGGPWTYQWNTNCNAIIGATSASIVVTTSGIYTLAITNGANVQTATVSVIVIPIPVVYDVTGGGTLCTNPGSGVAVGLNNSQTGIHYQLILNTNTNIGLPIAGTGSAIAFPNQTVSGTYTVNATTVSGGCTSMMNGSAVINLSNITLSATVTNVVCKGFNTGSVLVTPFGGVSPYSYVWFNGSTGSSLANLFAGTYQVTVTDAVGCTKTGAYTIAQPATVLSISLSKTTIRCGGASTGILTALPAGGGGTYSYVWSNGKTVATINSIAAGTYTVSVTDNNGCTKTKTAVMTENPVIIALAVASTPTIATVSVIGGVGPFAYIWNSSPQQTSITATGLIAGHTYKVKVTDNKGCTKIASVNMPLLKSSTTDFKNDLIVYPNPASGIVTISGFECVICKIEIVLTDVTGRKVYESSEETSSHVLTKDFTHLARGVYILSVEAGNNRHVVRIVLE